MRLLASIDPECNDSQALESNAARQHSIPGRSMKKALRILSLAAMIAFLPIHANPHSFACHDAVGVSGWQHGSEATPVRIDVKAGGPAVTVDGQANKNKDSKFILSVRVH